MSSVDEFYLDSVRRRVFDDAEVTVHQDVRSNRGEFVLDRLIVGQIAQFDSHVLTLR